MEGKLAPIVRDTQTTARLAKPTELRAEGMENRLRCNNVGIEGLPEKVVGWDQTHFLEQWLLEVFGKESFTPLYSVERAHRVQTGTSTAHYAGPVAKL